MDQSINVLLAIDKAHTDPQKALDCRPGLGGLNQVVGPNRPTPGGKDSTLAPVSIQLLLGDKTYLLQIYCAHPKNRKFKL